MASSSDVVNKIVRYKLQLTNTEEAAKVLKILQKLKDLEITLDVLAETGIGKTVNSLRRHELAGDLAKSLVRDWKKLVPKESKSPTTEDNATDTLACKDKLDNQVYAETEDDLNNNCLADEREEDVSLNKINKINKTNADQLEKHNISTNSFLNKTKVVEKERKKNHIEQHHNKCHEEDTIKRQKSEHTTGLNKLDKRKNPNRISDSESDNSDSGSDKKTSSKSSKKSKRHFSPESSDSEAQNRKRKKSHKEKLKTRGHGHKEHHHRPITKNKKAKQDKGSHSDLEEPAMSFESYLNYDVNVCKWKERPKTKHTKTKKHTKNKGHPKEAKAVLKEEPEKVLSILPVEPIKCTTIEEDVESPIESTMEFVEKITSPPLAFLFSDVGYPSGLKSKEKETDSCDILEESGIFTGQRLNKKMQVYSGAKTVFLPAMMSLYQQCIRTLQNNINLLYETGGVPFEILEPVLERCTPEQLLRIEEYNPIYIGVTDHLWGKHCQRDFKKAKLQEYESWKEMYVRLSEERERKFKMLTKSIASSQSSKPKGRQVKMAFIHSVAKPPRDVRIKQELHGTAVQQPQLKCSVKIPDNRPRQVSKEPTRHSSTTSATSSSQDPRKKTKVAPMMAKSLKAFKQYGRR